MSNNRLSVQQNVTRKRRTTVLSGKALDNILEDNEINDNEEGRQRNQTIATPKAEISSKEETKGDHNSQEPQDNKTFQAKQMSPIKDNSDPFCNKYISQFLTMNVEDEQNKFFDKINSQRKTRTVSRRILPEQNESQQQKEQINDNDNDDILGQLVKVDIDEQQEQLEQDMDNLLNEVEQQQKQTKYRGTDFAQQPQLIPEILKKPSNTRFSVQFEDKELKSKLVETHSKLRQINKMKDTYSDINMTQEDKSLKSIKSLQQAQSQKEPLLSQLEINDQQQQDDYERNSNDNSLATEEDFENYLEKLEIEDKARKSRFIEERHDTNKVSSIKILMDEVERHEKQQESEMTPYQQQHLAQRMESLNHSKISDKGMIDVIEEMDEEDEQAQQSDESFTKEFYQTMHQDVLMKTMTPSEKRKSQQILELTKDDWDYKDYIKIIDWNERRHQDLAKVKLKKNTELSIKNATMSNIKTRILTSFQTLNSVSNKIIKEKQFSQARATCVGLSEDLLLVGNSEGQVWMFDRESEDEYATFSEKSKEFLGNSVTCIDVHPLRTEYIIIGYERGQMVLVDATEPNKSVKVIKDHHKGVPITNIKFCDYKSEKSQEQQNQDKQQWMFISIDQHGKVCVNTISKVLFVMKASKHIIVDPAKYNGPIFSSISCRFSSQIHGQGIYDDMSIFAIGNADRVYIMEGRSGGHTEFLQIVRPIKFYNRSRNQVEPFKAMVPSLSWGHGMSPVLKERPHSMLAIAWGPLIQLVVMIDHEDTEKPFIIDGYYILRHIDQSQQMPPQQPLSKIRRSVRFNVSNEEERKSMSSSSQSGFNQDSAMDLEDSRNDSKNEGEQENEGKYDESVAFSHPEDYIEQIFFLSDSTMLVLTSNQEIRVLFTQGFSPDSYSHDKAQKRSNLKKLTSPVELENGIKVPNLLKSEQGAIYHQTMKFFAGKLLVLTYKSVMTAMHLTWQQSIYEFKKQVEDDLIQVFSRALNIYKGKVKGYQGLPDNTYLRESFLKAELKLLVKEIIYQVIEKTRVITDRRQTNQSNLEQELGNKENINKLEQYEDERKKKFETLIRIAIEFCVELKDCDFLFKDLFWLFQEERLEDLFVQELEPFIMAGKFQEWELPNEVIQNHVIKYYKDPAKADALEKIIVNLNLNQCPKTIVLEFIHFSEQNFLTTAILFLYTQVFERKDNTSCVQVLFSLFDLYKKANKKNQASLIDLQMLREASYDSQDKIQIEKSQIYLGYKILWVMRLFLNGKKFPQGNIREKKWRCYIHDIIQFLSNVDILKVLLDIDAETMFQIISILFYPSRPYELVLLGRDDSLSTNQQKFQAHIDFLKELDTYCLSKEAPDNVKSEYLFFVANVVAKSKLEGLEPKYFYNITKELLAQQKKYLEFNKNILEMANRKKRRLNERLSVSGEKSKSFKEIEEYRYIQKSESDFLNLLKKSEPLDNFQTQELIKLSELTQFDLVKLFLLEKKEEYIKCLQMLLTSQLKAFSSDEQQGQKIINWIKDKINLLEIRASNSIGDKNTFEQFKREVMQNIKKIVVLNPLETIKLVDEKFGGSHKEMIDSLSREPLEQMLYLETLLDEQEQTIQETIKNYGLQSTNPQEAKRYIEFLKLHLRLCCQHNQPKVFSIVEKMVKNSYYPIEDCLQICQEYKQVEAAFLLNKKLGKYFDSVQQGIEIIKKKVDLTKLKIELYFARKNGISTNFCITSDQLVESLLFDQIFRRVLKICSKNSKEVDQDKEELIWYIVIDTLLEMKQNNTLSNKTFCKVFFQERINIFVEAMSQQIPFQKFLDHILQKYKDIQFKDFRNIILMMFGNVSSEKVVLSNANNAIYKVNSALFQSFQQQTRSGVIFRSRICFICKRYMDSFLYEEDVSTNDENFSSDQEDDEEGYFYDSAKEQVKIFACRHTFHIRCLKKHYKNKPVEYEENFNKRTEKLRCPTCHIKSFEIEDENKPVKGARNAAAQKQQQEELKRKQQEIQSEEDAYQKRLQNRAKRMTLKSQTLVSRQVDKLQKKMDFYENSCENFLNINDFRKI